MLSQTEISAKKWIDDLIKNRGLKEAISIMKYNLTKNPFFKESNLFIQTVWNRINELNPS